MASPREAAGMSVTDNATIRVSPPDHEVLAAAFRAWAGDHSSLRVSFTPDVLIATDAPSRRGYLYDDGWEVEVFVDRGVPEFLALLSAPYLADHCRLERRADDPSTQRALLELVLEQGAPFDEVRHLI